MHAVLYAVGADSLWATWLDGNECRQVELGQTADVLALADALRGELRRTIDLAAGHVPLLGKFMSGWGRGLLPPQLLADPPDVVVFVPNAFLHDLPLHLVLTDRGIPIGAVSGVAFCSGMSMFCRCVTRNASRKLNASAWRFEEDGAPIGHRTRRRVRTGGVDVTATGPDAYAQLAKVVAAQFEPECVDAIEDHLHRPMAHSFLSFLGPEERYPDVACIVAHGDIDTEQHQLSGLLLAALPWPGVSSRNILIGERAAFYKQLPMRAPPPEVSQASVEVLTAAELELAGENASELVCILGCSAGWGRQLQGDEPASFAETMLRLGAASVIAPLWDAHVDATREWMEGFLHAWMRQGKPKALGARDATAQLLDRHGPERAGALTLRGDWL